MQIVVLVHTATVSAVLTHIAVGEVAVRCLEVATIEVDGEVCPELEHVLVRRVAIVHCLGTLCCERQIARVYLRLVCIQIFEIVCT